MVTPTPIAKLIAELRDDVAELEPGWYANVGARTGERCCAAMTRAAEALARQEELLAEAGKVVEAFNGVKRAGLSDLGYSLPEGLDVATFRAGTGMIAQWEDSHEEAGELLLRLFQLLRAAARLSDKLKGE